MEALQSLSDLLPYSPNDKNEGDCVQCLAEYSVLVSLAQEVIREFKAANLKKFDATVGENACQIRAIRMLQLYRQVPAGELDALLASLAIARSTCAALLSKADFLSRQRKLTFRDLLIAPIELPRKVGKSAPNSEEKDTACSDTKLAGPRKSVVVIEVLPPINVAIPHYFKFLVGSYVLTYAAVKSPPSLDNPLLERRTVKIEKLAELTDLKKIKNNFYEGLVRKYRKLIATLSCEFVRAEAMLCQDLTVMDKLSKVYEYDHQKCWPCLPMFWSYKVVLHAALRDGFPLLVRATIIWKPTEVLAVPAKKKRWFLFMKSATTGEYHHIADLACLTAMENEATGLFISGRTEASSDFDERQWEEKIIKENVRIILAGAASHRQYPNESKHFESFDEDVEFVEYRRKALKEGYDLTNPSTFFLQHVYANKFAGIAAKVMKA